MRTLQEIFNVVINAGIYSKELENTTSPFMCAALILAFKTKHITREEGRMARDAIKEYLSPTGYLFLTSALRNEDHPSTFEDRKAIYLDWENRPLLKGGWNA